MASDPAVYVGRREVVRYKAKAMKDNRYVGRRKVTHDVQPSSQQLVLIRKFLMRQQQLTVQLGPFGCARLKRGSD